MADAVADAALVSVAVAVDDATPFGVIVGVGVADGTGVSVGEVVDVELPDTPAVILKVGLAVGDWLAVGVAVGVAVKVEMGSAPTIDALHTNIRLKMRMQLDLKQRV